GNGDGVSDLQCSRTDAEEVAKVLKQHDGSKNFSRSFPVVVPQEKATAANILAQIEAMGKKVKPDDWLMVFLAGHGEAELVTGNDGKKYARPGTYFYVTRDCDVKKPETMLTSRKLYDALMKLNCRKMLVLDTCHSGAAAKDALSAASLGSGDQLRDMTREGKRLLVLSSCQEEQKALEPSEPGGDYKHGFFTHALLNVITDAEKGKGKPRRVGVTYGELETRLARELEALLKKVGADKERWHQPAFSPPDPSGLSVLCRPMAAGAGERRKR
ncbi:MAG: caspase family protein, partial [Gemmataceae bacterium]